MGARGYAPRHSSFTMHPAHTQRVPSPLASPGPPPLARLHADVRTLRGAKQTIWGMVVVSLVVSATVFGSVAEAPIGVVVGAVAACLAVSFFLVGLGVRGWKKARRRLDGGPLPPKLAAAILTLPHPMPQSVLRRLSHALDAVYNLDALLEHAPYGDDLPDVRQLRRDAVACLEHVIQRCEALVDLLAVQTSRPAVLEAQRAVKDQIDANLHDLHAAVDAAAAYVAVSDADRARSLAASAEQLHRIASGLAELSPSPTSAQPALPA